MTATRALEKVGDAAANAYAHWRAESDGRRRSWEELFEFTTLMIPPKPARGHGTITPNRSDQAIVLREIAKKFLPDADGQLRLRHHHQGCWW